MTFEDKKEQTINYMAETIVTNTQCNLNTARLTASFLFNDMLDNIEAFNLCVYDDLIESKEQLDSSNELINSIKYKILNFESDNHIKELRK